MLGCMLEDYSWVCVIIIPFWLHHCFVLNVYVCGCQSMRFDLFHFGEYIIHQISREFCLLCSYCKVHNIHLKRCLGRKLHYSCTPYAIRQVVCWICSGLLGNRIIFKLYICTDFILCFLYGNYNDFPMLSYHSKSINNTCSLDSVPAAT